MTITWNQLLTGVFVLVCTISGATFTMVKFAKESEIQEYQLKIQSEKEKIQQLEKRLALCFQSNSRETVSSNTDQSSIKVSNAIFKITSPLSGEFVKKHDIVQVDSLGKVPLGYKTYLYIRDPLGQWWSWGEIEEGKKMKVQFGEARDKDERFEVRVQLSDKTISKSGPHVVLPSSIASDSVIVIRQ